MNMNTHMLVGLLFVLLASCANSDQYYTTALSFPSSLNQPLVAVLTTRTQLINARGPAKVAIICHGQTGSMNADLLPHLNNQLLQLVPALDGVVRLDFTGHGASAGTWEYGNYAQEVSDLHELIVYLGSRAITVYATVGHSMGANIVLLHAHMYPGESPRVCSLSSRFNMTRGIFSTFAGVPIYTDAQIAQLDSQGWFLWYVSGRNLTLNVTQDSINERLAVDMSVVETISPSIPVILTHGTNDSQIPLEDSYALKALIPHAQLTFINGGSHNYDPAGAEVDVANTIGIFLGGTNSTSTTTGPCVTSGGVSIASWSVAAIVFGFVVFCIVN